MKSIATTAVTLVLGGLLVASTVTPSQARHWRSQAAHAYAYYGPGYAYPGYHYGYYGYARVYPGYHGYGGLDYRGSGGDYWAYVHQAPHTGGCRYNCN